MTALTVLPSQALQGEAELPGDKSISHRSLIGSALCEGKSTLNGLLLSEDSVSTLNALSACGVEIEIDPETQIVTVQGVGLHGLKASPTPLDCGNAGTAMRLLTGVCAAQPFTSVLTGDNSLRQRPMNRIVSPLQAMGAVIESHAGKAPLTVQGVPHLRGIHYEMPIASAQVKSALLFAGLYATGETTVVEPDFSRDHTERLFKQWGADISVKDRQITLRPGQSLKAQTLCIPGDISSAAFFMVGASFSLGSDVILKNVGINPRRTGIISVLQAMGANITVMPQLETEHEPMADIRVQGGALHGITVPTEWVVRAIDEFPAIFMAAACAEGETIIQGIEELRYKESDRIQRMVAGLSAMGVPIKTLSEGSGVQITGQARLCGATVDSGGDHRIAMALTLGALRADQPIIIENTAPIATSFPNFVQTAKVLGLAMTEAA